MCLDNFYERMNFIVDLLKASFRIGNFTNNTSYILDEI